MALLAVCLGVLVAAGCGSSKPEYCSKVDDLNSALGTLKSDAASGNISAIDSDLRAVKSDADAVVSAAKSDFPNQTSAIQSSINKLSSAIQALPPSPKASDLVPLVTDIGDVGTAVDGFKSATSSKCD